jgi:hypothetical protein
MPMYHNNMAGITAKKDYAGDCRDNGTANRFPALLICLIGIIGKVRL